ncbi:hypothetical protein [Bacillus toyonensis]
MKARVFYYENFAPNEKGKSYQKVHQHKNFSNINSREAKKILNHIPNLSNDKLLEELAIKIATRNQEDIEIRIRNMFIAKVKSFEANAFAVESKKRYWSDLVFFHVGLSDACFQFCLNLIEFTQLKEGNIDESLKENAKFKAKFFKDIYNLSKNSVKWTENENYIQLEIDTVVEGYNKKIEAKAATMATFTDMFILAHEISHHLLNHTGREHGFRDYLSLVPNEYQMWLKTNNIAHKNEFEADTFAILLLLGINPENHKKCLKVEKQLYFEMAFGILFTLEIIALLEKKEMDSSTHPAIKDRINNAKNILSLFVSEKILNDAEHLISSYVQLIMTFKNRHYN